MGSALKLRLRTSGATGGAPGAGGGGGDPIPAEYFGFHAGSLTPTTIWGDYSASAAANHIQTPWPTALGAGTIRPWDGNGCSWRNIERTKGNFAWGRLDYYLAQAAANNCKVIYTLGCGPDWATALPGQMPGLYVGYNPHPPTLDADWTAWCAAVAARIKNAGFPGAAYEIWNECNDLSYGPNGVGSGYAGTVERLVQLTQLARAAILAVDPTAIIVAPNFTGLDGVFASHTGAVALDSFIAAGGMAYADVVSIHGYNTSAPWTRPEGLIGFADNIKNLLRSAGIAKPVWNTEWGWGQWRDSTGAFHSGDSGTPAPDPMPDQMAADYISRMLILNWCVGFKRMCYYSVDAFHWASQKLYESTDHATPKVGAAAYAYTVSALSGGYLSGFGKKVEAGKEYYSASFTTSSGRIGRVYWCDDVLTASVPIPGALEIRSNVGASIALTPNLAVTGTPKFVFLT